MLCWPGKTVTTKRCKKIWKVLHNEYCAAEVPSITTVNRVLKRNGLVKVRTLRSRIKKTYPIFDPKKCNGLWRVFFRKKMLGYFDEKNLRIMDELGRLKKNNV